VFRLFPRSCCATLHAPAGAIHRRSGGDREGLAFAATRVLAGPKQHGAVCQRAQARAHQRAESTWRCSGTTETSAQELGRATAVPLKTATPVLEPIEWQDSWLDRMLHRLLKDRVDAAIGKRAGSAPSAAESARASDRLPPLGGHQGGHDDYDAFIRAALELSRRPALDTRRRTLALLYDLFPAWFVPAFRAFLSCWPVWFDARHAAASSVLLTVSWAAPHRLLDSRFRAEA
jgi:hypothetical protein